MNETEVSRIAAAINALRPDWPTSSIRTLIAKKLGHRARRDVAVALAWVACESDSKTPARVLEAGPWWTAAAGADDATSRPPKREEACQICGRYLSGCLCGERATRPPQPTTRHAEHAAAARAALRGVDHETEETP